MNAIDQSHAGLSGSCNDSGSLFWKLSLEIKNFSVASHLQTTDFLNKYCMPISITES